jgi:hypothetical protein
MKIQKRTGASSQGLAAMFVFALVLAVVPTATFSQVYKCVGSDGKKSFSANPVCENQQPYAEQKEPVLKVDLGTVAKAPAGELIQLHFQNVSLPAVIALIGDFAGIQLIVIGIPDIPITIDRPPTSWLAVLKQLIDEYSLDYRQAYNAVYIYRKGGTGQTIVDTPDLLRWYQTQRTWDVVLNNDALLLKSANHASPTLEGRLPTLLQRVRRELGEPSYGNAAEPVEIKESFDAGGTGTVAVNKGLYEVYEKQQADQQSQKTHRPRSVLMTDGRREAAEQAAAARAERIAALRANRRTCFTNGYTAPGGSYSGTTNCM